MRSIHIAGGIFCILLCLFSFSCSKKTDDAVRDEVAKSEENPAAIQADADVQGDVPAEDSLKILDEVAAESQGAADSGVQEKRVYGVSNYRPVFAKKAGIAMNPLLDTVPGGSFLLVASAGDFDLERADVEDFMKHASNLVMGNLKAVPDSGSAFETSVRGFLKGVFRSFSPAKLKSIGIMGRQMSHFVLYFVRQTPVLKVSLEDVPKFRKIVESYWTQNLVKMREMDKNTSHWSLVEISPGKKGELAFYWGKDHVIVTVVSDDEHASQLLPELLAVPAQGQTARAQLSGLGISDSTCIVGMFDINGALNQLVAIQETAKKFSSDGDAALEMACVKDLRRIASNIPKITFQVKPVSGGSVLGFDTVVSFVPKVSPWIWGLLNWQAQKLEFSASGDKPLAEAWLSVPAEQIIAGMDSYRDAVKQDPFKCPELEALNHIFAQDDADIGKLRRIAHGGHYIGAALYEGNIGDPRKYAALYRGERAADLAILTDVISSESADDRLEREFGNQPVKKAADNPEEAPDYSDADLEISDDDVDYGAELEVTKDEVLVASDKSLLGEVKGKDLESGSSLLHLDVSERGLTWQDADPERNFHLWIDLGTTPETFELTIRYAIE